MLTHTYDDLCDRFDSLYVLTIFPIVSMGEKKQFEKEVMQLLNIEKLIMHSNCKRTLSNRVD